jgi:radical SAM protein with 4Fe4S-binding SPASM domain
MVKRDSSLRYLPRILQLELTDRCNAQCVYCDRQRTTGGFMPLELFKRLVLETPSAEEIRPQYRGEPTLYPEFLAACEFCKQLGKRVCYYTNGSRLHVFDLKRLLSATSRIIISIESSTREHYSRYRPGLDFQVVQDNIQRVWETKLKWGLPVRVAVRATNVFKGAAERQAFLEAWGVYCDEVVIRDLGPPDPQYFCPQLCHVVERHCVIKWDGSMAMCPVDFYADYLVGNVTEATVLELFNSECYQQLRRLAGTEHKICRTCWFISS